MALLPLAAFPASGQAQGMSKTASQWARILRRLARKVAAAISECNDATRLMTERACAPDRYVFHPRKAPDTYSEFLFLTSGPLAHEPSARARAEARAHR
jgi:hypothetical protein